MPGSRHSATKRPTRRSNFAPPDLNQDWHDAKNQVLQQIVSPKGVGYISASPGPSTNTVAWPVIITAVADAIATLYVGYKVGNRVDDVADGIVRVLDAVAEVARSVAELNRRMASVIAAIERAVEILSRKFDSALMQREVSAANAAIARIRSRLLKMKELKPTDTRYARLVEELRAEERALFESVIGFVGQEQPAPSIGSLITCAPAVAAWSQIKTQLERIDYPRGDEHLRTPTWETAEHELIRNYFGRHFDDVTKNRDDMQTALTTTLFTPTGYDWAYRFVGGNFEHGTPPRRFDYLYHGGAEHDGWFGYPPGAIGDSLFATCRHPTASETWNWKSIEGNESLFGNPTFVKRANEATREKRQLHAAYIEYLDTTKDSEAFRVELMSALSPSGKW